MNQVLQGVAVSVLGITVTFVAMGLLVLVTVLLQRFCSPPPATGEAVEEKSVPSSSPPAQATENKAIVAAVAVALVHLRMLEAARSGLGESLMDGPGTWWAMGQIQQHRVGAWHKQGRR